LTSLLSGLDNVISIVVAKHLSGVEIIFFLNSTTYGSIKNLGFNPLHNTYRVKEGSFPYLARVNGILNAYYLTSLGEKRRLKCMDLLGNNVMLNNLNYLASV
jgi:hypothetical protein